MAPKYRTVSTPDLPLVPPDPALVFETKTALTFDWNFDVYAWALGDGADDDLTIKLAADILQSVTTPAGERYELGTPESIREFIDSTSMDYLIAIVKSWIFLVAAELGISP